MKPAVTQPRRRGARPGFPMRHKLAQLPFEAMEPMGMEVTGVVRHGLSRGSGEHRGRANQSSEIDGKAREGEDDGRQLRQTLPAEGAKTAHFWSMKISEDVRKFAAEQGITEEAEIEVELQEKAKEFVHKGAEIYVP